MPLRDRNVVLGVSGSIAAYKAADLTSKLVQAGALVDVILTDAAQEFVTPFTFRSLTGRPVYTNMFEPASDAGEEHVALARRADLVIVAPATATTLARLAYGLADDMVSLTVLATRAPILVAPAMDSQMWEAVATQGNVATLRQRGVVFVGPEAGRLASGHSGAGRLAEPLTIVGAAKYELAKQGDLAGKRIVVSAGGTREPIDPVRVITNRSSGKMGYALAEAARDRGASVTLVSTEPGLPLPYGVELMAVETVAQMREAVLHATSAADVLIMAAAVSDYRPAEASDQKLKKGEGGLMLPLVKNDSFFPEVPATVVKVAFAAETENLIENALRKPQSHGDLDLIVANDVSETDAGFAVDTNRVTLLGKDGSRVDLPLLGKYEVGQRILDR
ncbi:MAG TPA: bifunctional phosphopantothenoylcysteine decarboxylase/phosphopantothenate--cysteine ligase CoaBC, partial [Dehalococcoidia bacterium]|nr:bifunctional phosphopantothenoylcysteine decarboxylase/phosphopantothenate--cysteine ligase CoaBC [Dehalococcoidia bacterium]